MCSALCSVLCRVETDLGWKIVWDAFLDPAAFAERRRRRREEAASMRLSVQLDGEQGSPATRGACGALKPAVASSACRQQLVPTLIACAGIGGAKVGGLEG